MTRAPKFVDGTEDHVLALERELVGAMDTLRRKLGQDLHDDLGQVLTGIAFLADGLIHDAPPELRTRVSRLVAVVNDAIPRVRRLAEGLAPDLGSGGSLPLRLAALADATTATFTVPCTLDAPDDFSDVDPESGLQVFRIAQEAVTNAVRHAGCQRIAIALSRDGHRRALSVRDDGKGLPLRANLHGLGLRSMQYRARMLPGLLELRSPPRGGVDVRCTW